MTEMTGRVEVVVAFDCDGVLTNAGTTKVGQDNHQEWDVTPILEMLADGCAVGIMTCNVPEFVVAKLRNFGINAYVDPDITDRKYICPPADGRVMVSNRKLLADLYVDDHGTRWKYGDDISAIRALLRGES